jgi:hypothetical protein
MISLKRQAGSTKEKDLIENIQSNSAEQTPSTSPVLYNYRLAQLLPPGARSQAKPKF